MICPACKSDKVIKNGSIHNGNQKFFCKNCGRQFVENPTNKVIPKETWDIVDKLLLEKIPIAGIARTTDISQPWLQNYINEKYENTPQKIESTEIVGRLTIECDEMWSFVQSKKTNSGYGSLWIKIHEK